MRLSLPAPWRAGGGTGPWGALALLLGLTCQAHAAEGFKVRYPITGALGSELTVFEPIPGTIASVALTFADLTALNGNDGRTAWTPPVTNPAGVTQTAQVDFKQHQAVAQAYLGHVFALQAHADFVVVGVNVPYAVSVHRTLAFPAVRATRADGSAAMPGAAYLASLAAQAKANNISTSGLADIDLSLTWVHVEDRWKLGAGLSVGLPTGDFNSLPSGAPGTPAINVGTGRFYTFRPTSTLSYEATDRLTLGARAALGLNTVDTVDHWRSGDFWALELATVYRSAIGAFGTQLVAVKQFQDDSGGQSGSQPGGYGANRYGWLGAGAFYAVRLGSVGVNAGFTARLRAVNAISGNLFQVRMSQLF